MLNVHLSYKPPDSCRILFRSGGSPRKFSCMKIFRALVVPGRFCLKGGIFQGIMTPTGVLQNVHSLLIRKGGVVLESVHAPR